MKASELIARVRELVAEHGDLEVVGDSEVGPLLLGQVELIVVKDDDDDRSWNESIPAPGRYIYFY